MDSLLAYMDIIESMVSDQEDSLQTDVLGTANDELQKVKNFRKTQAFRDAMVAIEAYIERLVKISQSIIDTIMEEFHDKSYQDLLGRIFLEGE